MKSNNKKKQIISTYRVYDWVQSASTINMEVLLPCTNNGIAKVDTYQYHAISDGVKSVYTNEDELIEYGNKGILNPETVSFINLFVNGILQAQNQYIVETGKLTFISNDVPFAGSPITLQFVKIYL
ncbi:DUF4183 domain-containing protein [Bacillus sp. Bva_UNVM-123]|uniref:DUF4183 domain-containing protein n=1 Tax=Bacillus sp. Bva_UNVM-123 TaxID=2829798 RepID=UPI00391F31BC